MRKLLAIGLMILALVAFAGVASAEHGDGVGGVGVNGEGGSVVPWSQCQTGGNSTDERGSIGTLPWSCNGSIVPMIDRPIWPVGVGVQ